MARGAHMRLFSSSWSPLKSLTVASNSYICSMGAPIRHLKGRESRDRCRWISMWLWRHGKDVSTFQNTRSAACLKPFRGSDMHWMLGVELIFQGVFDDLLTINYLQWIRNDQ